MDWSELSKLFLVGAFPWISEFKNLDIHFDQPGIKTSTIFNFFASLFAMGIFVYSYYVNPYQLIQLPQWSYFLGLSCILSIIFFAVYMYNKDAVSKGSRKGIVIIQFIIYILIFASLTTCFGLLKVFKSYVVINGKVTNHEGIPTAAEFTITFDDNSKTNFKSKPKGNYSVMLKADQLDRVRNIDVRDETGESFTVNTFGQISVFDYLQSIKLIKQ